MRTAKSKITARIRAHASSNSFAAKYPARYPERMNTMAAALDLKKIGRLGPWVCCACGKTPEKFELFPIDIHPVEDRPPHFYYTMKSSYCPLCEAENYFLELSVVPEAPDGRFFFNDNCWEGSGPEYFRACTDKHEWRIAHYTNVREVSFEALPGENKPLVQNCARLDLHYFPTFAATDFDGAVEKVRAIARDIQPAIIGLRW